MNTLTLILLAYNIIAGKNKWFSSFATDVKRKTTNLIASLRIWILQNLYDMLIGNSSRSAMQWKIILYKA